MQIPDFTVLNASERTLIIVYAMIQLMLVVYANFYLIKRFLNAKEYWKYFLLLSIFTFVYYYADNTLASLIYKPLTEEMAVDWIEIIVMFIISTVIWFFKQGVSSQYQLTELQAKSAEMELNSLKAQINPHFLFNNLNNIYAINQMDSEKGSEMILELADVMRYHLQFSKQERVSLSDEIQLIKSYIELEKLRLNGNCSLQIDIQENESSPLIAPLLLLPFIENAFKHGTHPKENCFVHLKLFTVESQLHFEISNSVILNKKVVKTHIGVNNTVKRLELLYPKKHKLNIEHSEQDYQVKIEIDL